MNIYGEHLDNENQMDRHGIRSDDGLNRRWRSNTVHPFLILSTKTISKGRTQIVVQLDHPSNRLSDLYITTLTF